MLIRDAKRPSPNDAFLHRARYSPTRCFISLSQAVLFSPSRLHSAFRRSALPRILNRHLYHHHRHHHRHPPPSPLPLASRDNNYSYAHFVSCKI
ncbi:hypothetical protein PUN28_005502 [Cardiocondyla obscurior]|uniref:Uncharacterized protein n=1 Tax=Cardiocondyla obscurior TaxID=286306 RepID=A0AAW2GL73_9HYME